MIQELYIKNIALIDELRIAFGDGFNVLTGETGAGKSIIVDAVNLILGGRGDRELITHGRQSAYVEAQMELPAKAVLALEEFGFESEDTLIISRELSSNGKNICRINGRLATLSSLRELVSKLVNIYGQNQNHELLDDRQHLGFLDLYVGDVLTPIKEKIQAAYHRFFTYQSQLDSLVKNSAEKERLLDMLAYQIGEIEAASLKPDDEEELLAEKNKLVNAEKIAGNLNAVREALNGNQGAVPALSAARRALEEIAEMDQRYAQLLSTLNDAYYTLEDAAYGVPDDGMAFDEARLDQIEERLAAIRALKRKYGGSIEEILIFLEDARAQKEALEGSEIRMEELKACTGKAKRELEDACGELTELRKLYGKKLEKDMTLELCELGMKDAQFAIEWKTKSCGADGADEISFLITVNQGEPLKHLSKVASGGEISRIMLAMKNIVADKEDIGTVIFDEIDTGISGKMAHIVAEKMGRISRKRQVICVTHLPQIAAMGDCNFYIEKNTCDGRTKTSVQPIEGEKLQMEIARLSGGIASEVSMAHARELLENAHKIKEHM